MREKGERGREAAEIGEPRLATLTVRRRELGVAYV